MRLFVQEAGPFFVQSRSVFRATEQPSSCTFEGWYALRSPDTRTNDESPFPQQLPNAVRGPKQRGEHQPSKPSAWREELSRPRSPASTPRFDVPPEQRSWSLNMSWSQFNAGPHPRNMPLVAIQCSTSGAPPGCSGETCSLSEETKAPTATATRASCHEARHNQRSLPHPRPRVSSGGALLSSVDAFVIYGCDFYGALSLSLDYTSAHSLANKSLLQLYVFYLSTKEKEKKFA